MGSWKIGFTVICACCVAVPAFAAQQRSDKETEAAVSKALEGFPLDANNAYDISKIKLNKKEYLDQLSKSFDMMDKNGDGVVEGNEMAVMQNNNNEEDAGSPLKQTYPSEIPTRSAAPAPAPTGGIPPANQKDLLK